MKKTITTIILFIILSFSISVNAYYVTPPLGNQISNPNKAHNLSAFNGAELIQEIIISSSLSSDQMLYVFKGNNKASISYYDFSDRTYISKDQLGSSINYTIGYREDNTYSIEEMIGSELCIKTKSSLVAGINLNILNLGQSFEADIENKLKKEITTTHSYSISKSTTYSRNFILNSEGYYILQERGLFDVYNFVFIDKCYDVKNINGKIQRVPNSEIKYYLINNSDIRFVFNSKHTIGLYKYNFNGQEYVIDKDALSDSSLIYYL